MTIELKNQAAKQSAASGETVSGVPEIERRKVLDSAKAAAFVGLSVPHFRRLYRRGDVPKGMLIGERKLGWRTGDLCDWIDARSHRAA